MGVPGLWEILSPASTVESHTHLAINSGFLCSTKFRGLRIGIDASIWLFHSNWGKEGENPELRTLFFRCCKLLHAPFLPVFVFDGPQRPKEKRGQRINTQKDHALTQGMIQIIKAFGFEFWMAPGEAEAELAWLNRIGAIDAVLSDDSDTFVFGGLTIIRNASNTLSGNKSNPALNADGRDDKNHAKIFRLETIKEHPNLGLDTPDMVLMAVCMGGDYDQTGIHGCGPKIALGLARAGFGRTLCEAASNRPKSDMADFLNGWRAEIKNELTTNSRQFLPNKSPKLAKSIDSSFPSLEILFSYLHPITSGFHGMTTSEALNKLQWSKEPDMGALGHLCEQKFEWGYRDKIIYRFRTVVWEGAVVRILRRAVLEHHHSQRSKGPPSTPKRQSSDAMDITSPGTPSKMITQHFSSITLHSPSVVDSSGNVSHDSYSLLREIHSTRQHASTDGLLEYRVEIDPTILVNLTHAGIQDSRPALEVNQWATGEDNEEEVEEEDGEEEESGKKNKKAITKKGKDVQPTDTLRAWFPACMVEMVRGDLVEAYRDKKAGKSKKRNVSKPRTISKSATSKSGGTTKRKGRVIPMEEEEEEEGDDDDEPPVPPPFLDDATGIPISRTSASDRIELDGGSTVIRDLSSKKGRVVKPNPPAITRRVPAVGKSTAPSKGRKNNTTQEDVFGRTSSHTGMPSRPPSPPITSSSQSGITPTTASTKPSDPPSRANEAPTQSKPNDWYSAQKLFEQREAEGYSDDEIVDPTEFFLLKRDKLKASAATRIGFVDLSDVEDEPVARKNVLSESPSKRHRSDSPQPQGSATSTEDVIEKSPRKSKAHKSPHKTDRWRRDGSSPSRPCSPTMFSKAKAKSKPVFVEISSEEESVVKPTKPKFSKSKKGATSVDQDFLVKSGNVRKGEDVIIDLT